MWLLVLALSIWFSKTDGSQQLSATDQLPLYNQTHQGNTYNLTDDNGSPVYGSDISDFNFDLFDDTYLLQSLTRFTSERIPLRPLHTKGSGAFGYFEVTQDISDICKAKLFSEVGKKTKVVVRFSNQVADQGEADTTREAKGFSVKFYTEEGNWDLVSVNTPVFDIKNPSYFASLVHALKRNPQTRLQDVNARFDFLTARPETVLVAMYTFGDSGVPYSFRYIKGYPVHTYQIYNETGDVSYVRFRFEPDAGILNLNASEAQRIAGEDPDFYNRDLYEAILNGNYPSWTFSIQYMSKEDAVNASFNPFDITLMWPEEQYPFIPIGKLVLNENLKNHFAENEQLAFCPGNVIPGIGGGCDKMFEARRFTYQIAARHRLGSNFYKIKVNCPMMSKVHTYYRDGYPPLKGNEGNAPNYFPNDFGGPKPNDNINRIPLEKPYVNPAPMNYWQARDLYENGLTEAERSRLVSNIVSALSTGAIDSIKERAITMFSNVHPEFGQRISDGLMNSTQTNSNPIPIQD